MLPKQAVVEYQQIYRSLFGKEISFEKALEEGTKLLDLILAIEGRKMKYEDEESKPAHRV